MSTSLSRRRRHRRRRRNQVTRLTPAELLRRGSGRRISRRTVAACGVVGVICVALISLIWINTDRAVREITEETRARAESVARGQANVLAEEARRELAAIDQSLTILQSAWNTNPEKFDIRVWQSQLPVLTEVAEDIFVANDKHIIQQDVLPQAVGQGVGAAYVTFARGSLEPIAKAEQGGRESQILLAEGQNGVMREYLMYLVRPLASPPGWIMGASYRSSALVKVFTAGSLGPRGVSALIDLKKGGVQAVVGPAAVRPRLNVSDSPMFKAIQERGDSGIWIGPTAMDGGERIHAFRRIPGRDLVVLVGLDSSEWMSAAQNWALGARSLATIASLLVIAAGGIVLWELWTFRSSRRRRREMEAALGELGAAKADLASIRTATESNAAQVRAMLEAGSDAVAVFDPAWRLSRWNDRFAGELGLPPGSLKPGLPLDEWLRRELTEGRFTQAEDTEAEVARLVARIHAGTPIPAEDGLTLRGHHLPDGGVLVMVTGLGSRPPVDSRAQVEHAEPTDPIEL